MNLLLLEPGEVGPEGVAVLSGRRARHVRDVLRASPGRQVRVGLVRGGLGTAEVRSAEGGTVVLAVTLERPASPRPPVDLVLALPRPKALRRMLRSLAALGVGRLDLVNAWRVEKSYFDSPAVALEALERELRVGCEQGGTTWVPDVAVHRLLMPFLEGTLGPPPGTGGTSGAPSAEAVGAPSAEAVGAPSAEAVGAPSAEAVGAPSAEAGDGRLRVLLDPVAETPLERVVPPGADARVCLAVGPEGGWIDRERESLRGLGFAPAHLGSQVLTTGDAVVTALAQLTLLRRLSE